jgi:hypothetical protein
MQSKLNPGNTQNVENVMMVIKYVFIDLHDRTGFDVRVP